MNADEIVKMLRTMATYDCGYEEEIDAAMAAIDIIETLQAQLTDYHHMEQLVDGKMAENQRLRKINEKLQSQLAASQRRAQDARNELCQKCGRYRDAHKGACDGCRRMA